VKDKALNLLGLMRKAGAIDIGEDNTGETVKAGKAKVLILAADASVNAVHRAENFAAGRNVELVKVPFTKEEISFRVGAGGCSMAVITDIGFANAFMKLLAAIDEVYLPQKESVEARFDKVQRRKSQMNAGKNKNVGKRRTNA